MISESQKKGYDDFVRAGVFALLFSGMIAYTVLSYKEPTAMVWAGVIIVIITFILGLFIYLPLCAAGLYHTASSDNDKVLWLLTALSILPILSSFFFFLKMKAYLLCLLTSSSFFGLVSLIAWFIRRFRYSNPGSSGQAGG